MRADALAHHQAGVMLQQQGDLSGAAKEYHLALVIDPRLDITRGNLAGILHQLGDFAGAIEHYSLLLKAQGESLKVLYNLAVSYTAQGQLDQAASLFERCTQLDSGFIPAFSSLSWIHQQQGNLLGAISALRQLAKLCPDDHSNRYQLALKLREAGDQAEATSVLKDLVSDQPAHLAGRLLLADALASADPEGSWSLLAEIWRRDQGFVGSRELGERVAVQAADQSAASFDLKSEAMWLERLLKVRSLDVNLLFRLGDRYRKLERTTRALAIYQELQALRPEDPQPALLAAECLRRLGKSSEAQAALAALLGSHPDFLEALLLLAEICSESGRLDQAQELLRRALGLHPESVPAKTALAVVYAQSGKADEAYQVFRELIIKDGGDLELRRRAAGLCRKAAAQEIQATTWWERYLEFVPDDDRVLDRLAATYRKQGSSLDAARTYERLAVLRPEPAIWHLVGTCRAQAGDFREAATAFHQALATGGRDADPTAWRQLEIAIRVGLVQALFAEQGYSEAVAEAKKILAENPDHQTARSLLRQALVRLARRAMADRSNGEALEHWVGVVDLGPDSDSLRELAAAYERTGDQAGAERAYEQLLELEPSDRQALAWLGERCLKDLRPQQARHWFAELLKVDPQHLQAMIVLADLAWGAGDRGYAYDLYERIIALDPNFIPGVLAFARDALEADQPQEAWEYVKRILAQHPGQVESTAIAQTALRQLAERSAVGPSVEWWQRLIDLAPTELGALRGLNAAYLQLGSTLEALRTGRSILALVPEDGEVARFVAEQERRVGNLEAARAALAVPATAGDLACLELLAAVERQAGNLDEATRCLLQVLDREPCNKEAILNLAQVDLAQERFSQAWERLAPWLGDELAPDHRHLAAQAAESLACRCQGQEALKWYRRLAELKELGEQELRQLFVLEARCGDRDFATEAARRLLACTDDRDASLFLAEYEADQGRWDEVQKHLEPLADDPEIAYLLAKLAWQNLDVPKARQYLAMLRRVIPRHLEGSKLLAAVAEFEGKYEEAWSALSEVVAQSEATESPDAPAAVQQFELCRTAGKKAQTPAEAATWYRRLCQAAPEDTAAKQHLAESLFAAGEFGAAAVAYHELGQEAGEDPIWPVKEGQAHRCAGRPAQAQEAFARALSLNPHDADSAMALAELAEQFEDYQQAHQMAESVLRERSDSEARRISLRSCRRLAEKARAAGEMAGVVSALERATELSTNDQALWRELGDACRLDQQEIKAAAAYRQVWDLDSGQADIGLLAAELYRSGGQADCAQALLAEIIEQTAFPPALLALARLLWSLGDRAQAKSYLVQALELAEASSQAKQRTQILLMLSALCWQDESYCEAFEYADQAAALALPIGEEARQAKSLSLRSARQLAVAADANGMAEESRRWWQAVADRDPFCQEAVRRLAKLALDAGQNDQAADLYRTLRQVDPQDREAALALAECLLSLGRRNLARQTFEEAALGATNAQAALRLSELAREQGDPQTVWHWAKQAIAIEPASPLAAEQLAFAALALAQRAQDAGDTVAESAWWQELAALEPTGRERLLLLARGQARMGLLPAAANTLAKLQAEQPEDSEVAFELAQTWDQAGDTDRAIISYERVAEITAGVAKVNSPAGELRERALLLLARLTVRQGRPNEAWEWSQALLAIRPDHGEARELAARGAKDLACAAQAEGDLDSALLYRQVYLALRPEDREGALALAAVHTQSGRAQEAIAILSELATKHAGDVEILLALAAASTEYDPALARERYHEVLARDPQSTVALVAAANLAEASGDLLEAYELEARAASLVQDPVPHWLAQVELAWRADRIEDALAIALRVLEREPGRPEAIELGTQCCRALAQQAQDQGTAQEAVTYWKSLLAIDPDDIEAYREIGRIARASGDAASARQAFSKAIALDPGDRATAHELGLLELSVGNLSAARQAFAKILEQDPHRTATLLELAQLDWDDGDTEGAWYHTQELLAQDPGNEAGLELFGKLAQKFAETTESSGDLRAAVQWWELAWRQSPRQTSLFRRLGQAQARLGLLDAASDTCSRLLELDPSDKEAALLSADVYRQLGNQPKAEAALRQVISLDPRHIPSLLLLLNWAREREDPKEVMTWANEVLDVAPQNADALFHLAWAHQSLLEKKAALVTFEELLRQSPQHAEGWHQVAQLQRDLGDLEVAQKAATNAIVFGPRPDYHVTLGEILSRMGRWDEAVAAFGQALVLDPDRPDALAQLGFGLLQLQRPEQARPHLQRAVSLLQNQDELALSIRCALDLI